MPPLPRDRIEQSPPFAVTGLDFAGPIYVKNSKEKFYILFWICAVTRALHLELVTSLTTEAFLLAFRRFISRRGLRTVIYSDNAKGCFRSMLKDRDETAKTSVGRKKLQ
ncbi:integrase catalytic domain-containing protein [Trichonephila clavipes]|nr:integrase catalytic domain-containing protein [Trichonephila clavipes]